MRTFICLIILNTLDYYKINFTPDSIYIILMICFMIAVLQDVTELLRDTRC